MPFDSIYKDTYVCESTTTKNKFIHKNFELLCTCALKEFVQFRTSNFSKITFERDTFLRFCYPYLSSNT